MVNYHFRMLCDAHLGNLFLWHTYVDISTFSVSLAVRVHRGFHVEWVWFLQRSYKEPPLSWWKQPSKHVLVLLHGVYLLNL